MKHQELTRRIIGVFFDVYNELGHGFLESVYVHALDVALREAGLTVERELPLRVHFRNTVVGEFRADLVVGGAVLVEAKACECLHPSHKAQALNYLRATVLEVALLVNFGLRRTVKRLLFDNPLKSGQLYNDLRKEPLVQRGDPCPSDSFVACRIFLLLGQTDSRSLS